MAQRRMVHGWLVICVLLASSCAHAAWVGFTEGAGCVSSIIVNPAPYSVITLSPTFVVQFNLMVDLDLTFSDYKGSFPTSILPEFLVPTSYDPGIAYMVNFDDNSQVHVPNNVTLTARNTVTFSFSGLRSGVTYSFILSERFSVYSHALGPRTFFYTTCSGCTSSFPPITTKFPDACPPILSTSAGFQKLFEPVSTGTVSPVVSQEWTTSVALCAGSQNCTFILSLLVNSTFSNCIFNFSYNGDIYILQDPFCVNITKNDTTASIPLSLQPRVITPSYEFISTIPDAPTTTGEYANQCWKARSSTRGEVQTVLEAKQSDVSNQIRMSIYDEDGSKFHNYQAGADSLNVVELEKIPRYWAIFQFPNQTQIEIFYGPCVTGADAYWMIILPNMTFRCPSSSSRNTNYLLGPMTHKLQSFINQPYSHYMADTTNTNVDFRFSVSLSPYGTSMSLPVVKSSTVDSAILANSLHDALQGLCFLVPRGRGRFLDRQYWLVVSCGLLVDAMGKWGISPETFFTSQNGNCNAQQGTGMASPSMGYCLRNATDCRATVYQQVPYPVLLQGTDRDGVPRIRLSANTSTIDNSLKLTFNESVVPMNISLSDVKTKEAFAKLNETLVQVSLSNYRTASIVVGAWNSGESAATFSASVQCNPGISIVSTLSPTTINQQSNARLNFSIASTSNVTSSANCTITLAVTALPLWSKVNKIDTVTLPINIWNGCFTKPLQPQIQNAGTYVSPAQLYSFNREKRTLMASFKNSGDLDATFDVSLLCTPFQGTSVVLSNSTFSAFLPSNSTALFTSTVISPILDAVELTWGCAFIASYSADAQLCYSGDNTLTVPVSFTQCPPIFDDKKIGKATIEVEAWSSIGENLFITNGTITINMTGRGVGPALIDISYPPRIQTFVMTPGEGNCTLVGGGICEYSFTASVSSSPSPNMTIPASFFVSIPLENACATRDNKSATLNWIFPIPYNACIAQHDQPMLATEGVALVASYSWLNSQRTFVIGVTNSGNVGGTFGISLRCQNLTGPVDFAIPDSEQSSLIFPSYAAHPFAFHMTAPIIRVEQYLNCTAVATVTNPDPCWKNVRQVFNFTLDANFNLCLNGYNDSSVEANATFNGKWIASSEPLEFTSSISASSVIFGTATTSSAVLTCLSDYHLNITQNGQTNYTIARNQISTFATAECHYINGRCEFQFSLHSRAVSIVGSLVKCYFQSVLDRKQCQSPNNKTSSVELTIPLPYQRCADFMDSSLFDPFPIVTFSPWDGDSQNVSVAISNNGDQVGTFTTTIQCFNVYPQALTLFIRNTLSTCDIAPDATCNQIFQIQMSPTKQQLYLTCTATTQARGASTCLSSPSMLSFNFTLSSNYDPCLTQSNVPDSFIAYANIRSGNWTAMSEPFKYQTSITSTSYVTGNSNSNVTIQLSCTVDSVLFLLTNISTAFGDSSNTTFIQSTKSIVANVHCISSVTPQCDASFTLSTKAMPTPGNTVICSLRTMLDVLQCQSHTNKTTTMTLNFPIPYDPCASYNESFLLVPNSTWTGNPAYDKTLSNPLGISTTSWLSTDDKTARSLLLSSVAYIALSRSTIAAVYSCAWPPNVTAQMETIAFCDASQSSQCQFAFRIYSPVYLSPQPPVRCSMNVTILPQPCWSSFGKTILSYFNITLPISPSVLPQTEAYLLASESIWEDYNSEHNISIFGDNPLKAVTSVAWTPASYALFSAWANFTVLNAGPAHATLYGNLTFASSFPVYLDPASVSQCFAFANYSCMLAFRILTKGGLNISSVLVGATVSVAKQQYWSDVGKHFTQNVTIGNVPINICLTSNQTEPYLTFPELELLADPNKIATTQNPLGLVTSPWQLQNLSFGGIPTVGTIELSVNVLVYGAADVFSGVFCPAEANLSIPLSSFFDPISINVSIASYSSAVLTSTNNTFLHCKNSNDQGTCRYSFTMHATLNYTKPLFCFLVASINLEKCFAHPQLGKFFVQGFTLPTLNFNSSGDFITAQRHSNKSKNLSALVVLLPFLIAAAILARRYFKKSNFSLFQEPPLLVATGDVVCSVCHTYNPPHYVCEGCEDSIIYCRNIECHNALHSGDPSDEHRLFKFNPTTKSKKEEEERRKEAKGDRITNKYIADDLEEDVEAKGRKKKGNKYKYFLEEPEGDGTLLIGSREHPWYKHGVEERVEGEKSTTSPEVRQIYMDELARINDDYDEDMD